MQQRWFLSYHSPDHALAERVKAAIQRKDPTCRVFFAPTHLRAGGIWTVQLAQEIADATAFILLVGERGLGSWQLPEYDEALDRRVKSPDFPVILMLLAGQTAPGLPFLRQLHWIVTPDPGSEKDIARLLDAASGGGTRPGELWRHTSPYRGLTAMEEKDSDYFFGRERETIAALNALVVAPDKIPILLGNSGVGKSSVAQAGVLAALRRQAWPEAAENAGAWPAVFGESRRWCFLTLRPGTEPVRSLVEPFLDTWQLDRTSTEWPERRAEWVDKLLGDKLTLRDLLDQTKRRYAELRHPEPAAFLVYVDQGEELYARAGERHRRRFSELLAQGLGDPRLHALMSIRADFFGELQKDQPLYEAHRQINIPPLREVELRKVVRQPAELLSARFETDRLATTIARRTAEESTKDAGALPLLSYLLDDMWTRMVKRDDGVLRLPEEAFELGGVLVERANAFMSRHPNSEDTLRRIFTLKLATVREDGEPTRRRAWRSEFSDAEWRLVSELADHPNRLLVTAAPEASATPPVSQSTNTERRVVATAGLTYVEVAHEAIFLRWDKLREWIAAERGFLAWRTGLEAARRAWQEALDGSKTDALLMGLALAQAQSWLAKRLEDIPEAERAFIVLSRNTMRRRTRRVQALVGALVVLLALVGVGWRNQDFLREQYHWRWKMGPSVLSVEQERTAKPGSDFKECATGCPTMVVVPAGKFTMGSPDGEKDRSDKDFAQHEVTIAKPFAVGRTEVTFAEWDVCVAANSCFMASDSGWGRGDRPVINVSWYDAKQYVDWLARVTGKKYRLLSEAEWEYAARAGSRTRFSFGDDEAQLDQHAWYGSNSGDKTHPVAKKAANAFGLHDMHGNAYEWVEDRWHNTYEGAPTDGSSWVEDGEEMVRVVHGGSWQRDPKDLRAAHRDGYPDGFRDYNIGFRLARTLNP